MSEKNFLDVEDVQISSSEEDEVVVDVWDDSKLNLAYDSALRFALAATNNIDGFSDDNNKSSSSPKVDKKKFHSEGWEAGMHCRAIYENDGVEYEATVISVTDDSKCVIKFSGYDESVVIPLKSLKPSHGETVRTNQIKSAAVENEKISIANGYNSSANSGLSENQNQEKKKNITQRKRNSFKLPDIPVPISNLMGMRNMGSMDLPPPPLLSNILSGCQDTEGQAQSSMLISWYMSGYYTGLYSGLSRKRDQSNTEHTIKKRKLSRFTQE